MNIITERRKQTQLKKIIGTLNNEPAELIIYEMFRGIRLIKEFLRTFQDEAETEEYLKKYGLCLIEFAHIYWRQDGKICLGFLGEISCLKKARIRKEFSSTYEEFEKVYGLLKEVEGIQVDTFTDLIQIRFSFERKSV